MRAPELRVQLTKRPDGGAVLRCVRADGSATWQRQEGARAAFFPFHDLTHLAVESTLGFGSGFYGLVADGWDIDDTSGKGRRGRLPAEAVLVEHLVGLLDRERMGGAPPLSAAELRALLETAGQAPPDLGDAALDAARARIAELHGAWAALAAGETLELPFDRRDAVRHPGL